MGATPWLIMYSLVYTRKRGSMLNQSAMLKTSTLWPLTMEQSKDGSVRDSISDSLMRLIATNHFETCMPKVLSLVASMSVDCLHPCETSGLHHEGGRP